MKQQDSQLNAQAQSQAAQVAEQAKQQTLQIEMQADAQKLQMEGQLKSALSAQEHQQKMQQIQLQMEMMNKGKVDIANINHESSLNTMAYQSALSPQQENTQQGVI